MIKINIQGTHAYPAQSVRRHVALDRPAAAERGRLHREAVALAHHDHVHRLALAFVRPAPGLGRLPLGLAVLVRVDGELALLLGARLHVVETVMFHG